VLIHKRYVEEKEEKQMSREAGTGNQSTCFNSALWSHFGGAGAQTPKNGIHRHKSFVTELKHKQHYTNVAVLDLRLLLAGLDGYLTFSL